jgi:hypothetical protein
MIAAARRLRDPFPSEPGLLARREEQFGQLLVFGGERIDLGMSSAGRDDERGNADPACAIPKWDIVHPDQHLMRRGEVGFFRPRAGPRWPHCMTVERRKVQRLKITNTRRQGEGWIGPHSTNSRGGPRRSLSPHCLEVASVKLV